MQPCRCGTSVGGCLRIAPQHPQTAGRGKGRKECGTQAACCLHVPTSLTSAQNLTITRCTEANDQVMIISDVYQHKLSSYMEHMDISKDTAAAQKLQ